MSLERDEDLSRPLVSAVIPTIGRLELSRAIESVRAQVADFEIEVVVVNDGMDAALPTPHAPDKLVWTGGGRRGGFSRNRGVEASSGSFIAFLDDDDEWMPDKLARQIAAVRSFADPDSVVMGGRHIHVRESSSATSKPGPDVLIAPGQSVSDYLFRRRRPQVGRASMYTSTLLTSKNLAREVPWREDLSRHQDWDWLVRLQRVQGTTFAQVEQVVARIQTGSSRSISASADWRSSKAWADDTLSNDPSYTDFLVAQTLRYALNARSAAGVRAVLSEVASRRVVPGLGPVIVGLAGAIPRRELERLMTGLRGARSGHGAATGADRTPA